jgi:hydrogenase maturation protein HypF
MKVRVFDWPIGAPGVLALGGWSKITVCAVRGQKSFVSEIVDDLDEGATYQALEQKIEWMCTHCQVDPVVIAHDLHPDFFSTRLAQQMARRHGIATLGVQHHHAHIAAVCAEHGVTGTVLGLAMDGFGMGSDGQAWGGELLRVGPFGFDRIGHLLPLHLPGGDCAARQPWRMAASALACMDRQDEIPVRFADQRAARTVAAMLERDFNCPLSTSLGRLFDAAAGLLGLCPVQSFEGQAAMELEALAQRHGRVTALDDGYNLKESLDFRGLLSALSGDIDRGYGASLFHATVAAGLADWVEAAADRHRIFELACGGGCFLNRLLVQQLTEILSERKIKVMTASCLSPGDSGLSVGQAWVAVQKWKKR